MEKPIPFERGLGIRKDRLEKLTHRLAEARSHSTSLYSEVEKRIADELAVTDRETNYDQLSELELQREALSKLLDEINAQEEPIETALFDIEDRIRDILIKRNEPE